MPDLVELFHALESPLLGFAYQMVKDEQFAQDIVQEAFIRLQKNLTQVEMPKAWLYTTVRRLSIDHLRRASKVVPFSSIPKDGEEAAVPVDQADPGRSPGEDAEYHEHAGLMRICIERLEPRARSLVQMKFIENLSYKQISARMGMTVGNVGYCLHHALKALEIELSKEGIAQ